MRCVRPGRPPTEYVQNPNPESAKVAAKGALLTGQREAHRVHVAIAPDGSAVFTVTAKGHADTRAFKFLRYVGLKKWVDRVINPTATRTSQ